MARFRWKTFIGDNVEEGADGFVDDATLCGVLLKRPVWRMDIDG